MDISVIIPTYNRAWLLPRLLTSWREVDRVTKPKYELIFSDDGSTDDSIATLKAYENILPITIIENQHGAAGKARNAAIARASGKRILMIGDDIFPTPNLLNRHFELGCEFGPATALLGDIKWHPDLKLSYLMTHITEVGHEQFSLHAFRTGDYLDYRHFYTSNISIDVELLKSEPVWFDERFSKVNFEDVELGYRLTHKGLKIRFDSEACAYHYHPYTVSGFCERQQTAGEMAVVFMRLHPELDAFVGVGATRERYLKFRSPALAGIPRLTQGSRGFDPIIKLCECYEYELPLAPEVEQKYLKLALSSLYTRLFRACFEYGILNKLDPSPTDYFDYLNSVYFNSDGYWNLYLEAEQRFKDLSDSDRNLRELILLSYADQTVAGMQIALAEKEVQLLRLQESNAVAEHDLNRANTELDRINASYAWTIGRAAVYPAKLIRNFGRKLKSGPRSLDDNHRGGNALKPEQAEPAEDSRALAGTRLGILLAESALPSPEARDSFLAELGPGHCFIVQRNSGEFQVLSEGNTLNAPYDSLPVDYFYEPQDWNERLSLDQFRNVLLCLSHVDLDFVLVSPTLQTLPEVAVSSSVKNHLIFATKLGLDFPENQNAKARGRVLRLLPPNAHVNEVSVEEIFSQRKISYAPDPGRYLADQGYLYLNQDPEPMSDASASEIRATQFIPKFRKQKKVIFVLPMVMAIGGVERNAIDVMRQLNHLYDFVVITMDRHDQSRGSLHHQLKDLTVAVYDLMELGHLHYFLAFLDDLKQAYEPDAVWICNGMLWLCDHAEAVRRIFHDVPIIDNQAWDAEVGWSEFYHLPGIQSFDRFVATNSQVYRKFVEELKMNPDRIDSIYPCFDAARFGGPASVAEQQAFRREFDLPDDRPIFLFCGRLHEQKGPFDFLELARRRLRKNDDAFFVMRGTGALAPEVDKFIADHKLTNLRRIRFVEDTVPLLSLASGQIITSHYETITIVLLEALSMGLPILSTDVGDIRLVVEQYGAGLIVPEIGDADAFESAYEKWRENLDTYAAKARESSDKVRQRFSSATIAQQYARSWERAMLEFAACQNHPREWVGK